MSTILEVNIDFDKLSKEYDGKWVALDPETDTVIASGSSAAEVLRAANDAGVREPFIVNVVSDFASYVPCLIG